MTLQTPRHYNQATRELKEALKELNRNAIQSHLKSKLHIWLTTYKAHSHTEKSAEIAYTVVHVEAHAAQRLTYRIRKQNTHVHHVT